MSGRIGGGTGCSAIATGILAPEASANDARLLAFSLNCAITPSTEDLSSTTTRTITTSSLGLMAGNCFIIVDCGLSPRQWAFCIVSACVRAGWGTGLRRHASGLIPPQLHVNA